MKIDTGFNPPSEEKNETIAVKKIPVGAPTKSLVRIFFPERNMTLSYYNDAFDLKCGDLVYVDGKLEGLRGRVVEVSLNFKIKLSDYKRVIALANTEVAGEFYMAGSHLITFDPHTLPFSKVASWFRPPETDEDYVTGSDDTSVSIRDLSGMNVSDEIAERGHDYYLHSKVSYMSVDGDKGHAIVEGSRAYEVEFKYGAGELKNLTCTCFCAYPCKHEFAAILQLKETLERIKKDYGSHFKETGYFAAISKTALFTFVIDEKNSGTLSLGV